MFWQVGSARAVLGLVPIVHILQILSGRPELDTIGIENAVLSKFICPCLLLGNRPVAYYFEGAVESERVHFADEDENNVALFDLLRNRLVPLANAP